VVRERYARGESDTTRAKIKVGYRRGQRGGGEIAVGRSSPRFEIGGRLTRPGDTSKAGQAQSYESEDRAAYLHKRGSDRARIRGIDCNHGNDSPENH
jgi:hypothetical protein